MSYKKRKVTKRTEEQKASIRSLKMILCTDNEMKCTFEGHDVHVTKGKDGLKVYSSDVFKPSFGDDMKHPTKEWTLAAASGWSIIQYKTKAHDCMKPCDPLSSVPHVPFPVIDNDNVRLDETEPKDKAETRVQLVCYVYVVFRLCLTHC